MNLERSADKAAIIILLKESDQKRSEIEKNFTNVDELVREIQYNQDIQIIEEEEYIRLRTGVSFDLFQDVPPQVRKKTREKVEQIDPDFFSYNYETTERPIADLTQSDIDSENIKDFRPEPALPIVWENRMDSSNTRDKQSWQVCPDDAVRQLDNGQIVIEDESAPGTILAAIKDPFNMIKIRDGFKFGIDHYTERDDIKWVAADQDERTTITSRCLEDFSQTSRKFSKESVKNMLDRFEERTGRNGRNWDQDPYYLFTRNSLRLIGMDAQYTGAPGMKTRSDITVFDPVNVTIEVKSPAESKVNKKAVRQAFDSSVPFSDELEGDVYKAAIGAEISGDAKEHSQMYKRGHNIRIPLITGRTLLFLTLVDAHESLTARDLRYLFGQLYGEVTADDIREMYERHIDYENSGEDVLEFVDHCL